ncbi:ABC transporter permease [Hyphomicrobium sulfonivorans]|nr:ABC transporter permease [Hyphomicrobium sulfonivorans]
MSMAHPLGTDNLGRDYLSRLLFGGRTTLGLAVVIMSATMAIGFIVGAISGYLGGVVDILIQSVVAMFQGLPGLAFMLTLAGVLGPGATSLFIALVVTAWADFSRIVRAETLRLREAQFIEAARVLGAGQHRIIVQHLMPNLVTPLIVLFTSRIGRMILTIASLSFLGLGLQPPTADWGVMISDSRAFFRSAPHLMVMPGLCIFAVSLAINIIGDDLRDRMDRRTDRWMVS